MGRHGDPGPGSERAGMEERRKFAKKGLACWDGVREPLKAAMEGFNGFKLDAPGLVDCVEVVKDCGGLGLGDGDSSGGAIEEPAKDLLSGGPDAIQKKLLVGNGVFHRATRKAGWGKMSWMAWSRALLIWRRSAWDWAWR